MHFLRVALCQINPTVGDISGNSRAIIRILAGLKGSGADIIAFPELAITGYPPEDLLLKPHFIDDNLAALEAIREQAAGAAVVVGFVDRAQNGSLFNAAALLHQGRLIDIYHKAHLPNYGVFDEVRYFRPGSRFPVYALNGVPFGINICEDIWYSEGPASVQARQGARLIVNINASPFHMGKSGMRIAMLMERAEENNVAIAYLNTVGGQDELIFDGHSLVLNRLGEIIAEGVKFAEEILLLDIPCEPESDPGNMPALHSDTAASRPATPLRQPAPSTSITGDVYQALVLGTRDYVSKNGFSKVCIGLSGGIDSSLVASVAVDAIGKESVTGIFMPSEYTSAESGEDAYALASSLDIAIMEIPIQRPFEAYLTAMSGVFSGLGRDTTEENLQARVRGNILMALSNKFGWLVLTTGNKSEMSVGYATLYGDMAGGFDPVKDVPKTLVYELCAWKNASAGRMIIPERVLVKEPTAELSPGQKDSDSLPPYPILDPILKAYVEDDRSCEDIISMGFAADVVRRVISMVDRNEYKRRQAPPGIKITPRAFGRDRRFPITNRYRSC